MIQVPEGFQASDLLSEYFHLAAPFAGIAFLIACGFLVSRMIQKMP